MILLSSLILIYLTYLRNKIIVYYIKVYIHLPNIKSCSDGFNVYKLTNSEAPELTVPRIGVISFFTIPLSEQLLSNIVSTPK